MDASSMIPIGLDKHILFCVFACTIYILQFIRNKRWYQLIMTAAIAFSLTLHLSDSHSWFTVVGIVETVLLLAALVISFVQPKLAKNAASAVAADMTVAAKVPTELTAPAAESTEPVMAEAAQPEETAVPNTAESTDATAELTDAPESSDTPTESEPKEESE